MKKIPTRNLPLKDIPKTVGIYRFFDRKELNMQGENLSGEPFNYSKTYYVGRVMKLEEVIGEFPEQEIAIRNMEINHWKKVIRTRTGDFIKPHDNKYVVVPEK